MSDEHENRTPTRRAMLRAGAAAAAAGLAGCASVGSPGSSEFDSQLETVRSATESYTDPKAALGDGFRVAGPVAPGQGWHFINPERVQAAAQDGLSVEEPQVLTYDRELNLVAVEWAVPSNAVDEAPDLFADEGADATEEWHTHEAFTHVMATGNGQADDPGSIGFDAWTTNDNWAAFRPPNRELSPGDEVSLQWGVESPDADEGGETRVVDVASTHPSIETLHAWLYKENPEGMFHPTHPDVAGGGGHDHEH